MFSDVEAFVYSILIFLLVALVIAVVFFVVQAIGLYMIAKGQGRPNAWMAWVPLANLYLMGMMVEDRYGQNMKYIYPLAAVTGIVGGFIPVVGTLLVVLQPIVSFVLGVVVAAEILKPYFGKAGAILLAIFISPVGFLIAGILHNGQLVSKL